MDDNEQLTADEQAALDSQRNAPEPEAQPAPETPQEGATGAEAPEGTEQPPADKRPQMVPHAALHEERERRKEVERQAAEDRRKYEARVEKMMEAWHPPAQPEAKPAETPLPDFQQDPAGYIVADLQRKGASIEEVNRAVNELRQQQQQQQIVADIRRQAVASEAAYRQEQPDYGQAVEYLRGFRERQLAVTMPNPAQRAAQIEQEYLQISAHALQQGVSPAEIVYKMAQASGYTKPNGEQPAAADAVAQAGGTAGAPDQAARLQMVQRGQEHARSLGNVRGNGPSPMTAAKLLEMPDENFDEIIKVMRSPAAKKLMGA